MNLKADECNECREMTYSEMIALPDNYGAGGFEDGESNSATDGSLPPTPTPRPIKRHQPSPASTVHNININYRHTYSVKKKNGDEVDLPTLLQGLAKGTSIESASKVLMTTTDVMMEEPLKRKRNEISHGQC